MKKLQRLLALLIALMMIFSVVTMASAAGEDAGDEGGDTTTTTPPADPTPYELFVKNNAPNHVYDAYQIFAGDLSVLDGTTYLSNIQWGSSLLTTVGNNTYANAEALITALTTDAKPIELTDRTTTLKDVFIALTNDTNRALPIDKKAAVVAEILGTISNDSAVLDRFAEVVGKVVYNAGAASHTYLGAAVSSSEKFTGFNNTYTGAYTGTYASDTQLVSTDEGEVGYIIPDLPAGYYLIKDRDNTVGNEGDFYSKYMVRVVNSAMIAVKGEGVRVTKTVNDTLNGTFTEHEDGHTNETIYFKLEGTLPNNLGSYDTYNYKFIDNMATGLTYKKIETIYIENYDGTVATTIYTAGENGTDAGVKYEISETVGDTTVTKNYLVLDTENTDNTFSLEFVDLFKIYHSILPSQKVIVKYSAYMNRNALIAEANENTVTLEYSNNPNGQGTGTTVPDTAYAFTYKMDINKYDSAYEANSQEGKLEGVEFILYYQLGDNDAVTKYYAQVITEEMIDLGTTINGKVVEREDVGVVYGYTTLRDYPKDEKGDPIKIDPATGKEYEVASILDTDAKGAINLRGLHEGIFYLEEINTKAGYNKLDTPVQVQIKATYTEDTAEGYKVAVKYEVDGMDQGNSTTVNVRNSKGATLPSTGGMGTTIFYIVGAVLVVGAGVILITKKRMANEK